MIVKRPGPAPRSAVARDDQGDRVRRRVRYPGFALQKTKGSFFTKLPFFSTSRGGRILPPPPASSHFLAFFTPSLPTKLALR